MSNYDFDVIICGGGPGGSTCAMAFVDSGIKVGVIEKSNYPRKKVCGDGLAPYIPKALKKISPSFEKAFQEFSEKFSTPKIILHSYNGNYARINFPESFMVSGRYEFDNFLYEQASSLPNVTYIKEAQVSKVEISDDHALVSVGTARSYRCKIVIGCDGATSIVRRSLTNYEVIPEYTAAAVRGYYEGVAGGSKDTMEFYFMNEYPLGYFWIFPSYGTSVNVGFGIHTSEVIGKKIKMREVIAEIIEGIPSLKERFRNARLNGEIEGWSIPLGYGTYPISGKRFLLAGDAASLADPATGEGIGIAMVSGRIAAYQTISAIRAADFSAEFMKKYDRDIEIKFGRMMKKRDRIFKYVAKNRWILNLGIKILNKPTFLSRIATNIIIGAVQ